MKRIPRWIVRLIIKLGLGFLAGACAMAQVPNPIPVTGNLTAISGQPQAYSGILIQLANCPTPASITGYSAIVQTAYQIQAGSDGSVNATVWPNDLLTCNGTTGSSQYSLVYLVNGTPSGTPQCYQVTSTQGIWNLNTQQPITCGQTPPNPQDASFQNLNLTGFLQAAGGLFTGPLTVQVLLNVLGGITLPSAQPCTSGLFMTGITQTLVPQCAALPSGGVASFNGRSGAVLPTSGDYTYGQISGTPAPLTFSSRFAVTAPNVDLANSGVGAGTYSNVTVTVDAFGRVTSISSGPVLTQEQSIRITSGICTANGSSFATCPSGPFSWPAAFADTNYAISCFGMNPSNGSGSSGSISGNIYSATVLSSSTFNLTLQTVTSSGFTYGEIDCFGKEHQ